MDESKIGLRVGEGVRRPAAGESTRRWPCLAACGLIALVTGCAARPMPSSIRHRESVEHVDGNTVRHFVLAGVERFFQKSSDLCWAACIQSVLHAQNIEIGQEDIAKHVYGDDVQEGDRRAWTWYLNSQQDMDATTRGGVPAAVLIDVVDEISCLYLTKDILLERFVTEIGERRPFVLLLSGDTGGHAYLVTGVVMTETAAGERSVSKLRLFDPLRAEGDQNPDDKDDVEVDVNEVISRINAIIFVPVFDNGWRRFWSFRWTRGIESP